MFKRISLFLALAALAFVPQVARANDPNYTQTVFIHTKGLTSSYLGDVRVSYTFDGKHSIEKKAMGSLPTRIRVPSMAADVTIEGTFAKHGSPKVTVTKHFPHFDDSMTLDFTGKVQK